MNRKTLVASMDTTGDVRDPFLQNDPVMASIREIPYDQEEERCLEAESRLSDGAEERVMQLVVSGRVVCDLKIEGPSVVVGTQNLAKSASRRTVHDDGLMLLGSHGTRPGRGPQN